MGAQGSHALALPPPHTHLLQGTYGDIYNFPQAQYAKALEEAEGGFDAQLEQSEGKLRKVEAQLNKTKQWVRELGNIKEDIITLK